MAVEKLSVILELVSGNYKREAREAATATSQIGTSAKTSTGGLNLMRTAAVGLVATKLISWARDSVESLARIERIGAQTDAALRSTGGAANVTREEIDGLAGSLENLTSVEAESITEGQNLLLTFTKIRNEAGEGNDIFDQTTKIMVDMSVAMGTDAAGSAIQLGKALNDPVAGITALTRVGVTFTKDQKELIATLVETGDLLGAQKIILAELNTEFGGSAEALGATLTGRIEALGHAFGAMGESIAEGALPAVEDLIVRATELFDTFGPMSAAAATAKATLASLVTDGIDVMAQKIPAAVTALQATFQAMGPGVDETERMAEVLGVLNQRLEFSATDWGDLREAVASGRVDLDLSNQELEVLIGLLQTEEAVLSSMHPAAHRPAEIAALNDQIAAQLRLNDSQLASLSSTFAVANAANGVADAHKAYTAAILESGLASDETERAALRLGEAELRLDAASRLFAEEGGPAGVAALEATLLQAGVAKTVVDGLIESILLYNTTPVAVKSFTTSSPQLVGGLQEFATGGTVQGSMGQPQLIIAHGGEVITPAGKSTTSNSRSQTFYFAAPVKPVDLQWISLQNNLETLVS